MGDVTSAQIDIINGESFEEDVLKNLVQENSEEQQLRSTSLSMEGLGYKIFWTNQQYENVTGQDSKTQGEWFINLLHSMLLLVA